MLGINSTIVWADASLDELIVDRRFMNIVAALGVGISLYPGGLSLDLDRLRYERIIITMDSGPKGMNAGSQVLSVLAKHFEPVVAAGHVYTASLSHPQGSPAANAIRTFYLPRPEFSLRSN